MNEKSLLKLQKLAFNQALYRTGSIDVAEDIASQTIYIYLLKNDMIENQNLNGMKFLIGFKQHLEDNSLHKMYRYFSRKDLENYNPCFYIVKVCDYEIILKDSVYTIHVFFESKEGKVDSFYFSFCVDKNHLKIVTPPTPPRTHLELKLNSEDGQKVVELLEKYPEDKKGMHNIPEEDIEMLKKIIEKYKN